MTKSIFQEIYFAHEGLYETLKPNERHNQLTKEAGGYYDKLFGILGGEAQKWLDEIWLLEAGIQSEWGFMNFQEGFKYGMRLLAETFGGSIQEKSKDEK